MSRKVTNRLITTLAIFAILLTACGGSSNKLIGEWEYVEPTSGMTITVEFTKDTISFSALGMDPIEATYTLIDDNTIKVLDPDSGDEEETTYKVDGDKLTIDFGGETVEFTKTK